MATSEIASVEPSRATSDYRWLIVAAFYVSAALVGLTSALSQNALVAYLGTLLMACTAAEWCLIDSSHRGSPMTWSVQFLVLAFWSLAAPLYLLATRGWRGVGWVCLHVVGIYATIFATYYLTYRLFWRV